MTNKNWCLSGGAIGADLAWGHGAEMMGHEVTHFTFVGHRTKAPPKSLYLLNDDELASADPHCLRASHTLKKRFSNHTPIRNLLRRNWFQVQRADACYAIATIEDGIVQGGTGWAVQMFIDRNDGAPCDSYVFDQTACFWYQWVGHWKKIYTPPPPAGVWAGIGTRKINFTGRLAINVVLGYWPREKTIWSN